MKIAMKDNRTEIIENIKREFLQKFFKQVSSKELNFLLQLPIYIKDILLEKFQGPVDEKIVKQYFRKNSFLSRVLMKNPATFKMLELLYTGEDIEGSIDRYSFNTPSAQAMRNRLLSVTNIARSIIRERANKKIEMKVSNLGSGPGRDTIEILAGNS
jgi:hypothetical protein